MSADTPRCGFCARKLRPIYGARYTPGVLRPERLGIEGYGYQGENVFCSLRCGYRWALNHYGRKL